MKNLQHIYDPSMDFNDNRKYQELAKACKAVFTSITSLTSAFPKDSSLWVLNTIFKDGYAILDLNWASRVQFNFTLEQIEEEFPRNSKVELVMKSLWRKSVDSSLEPDTFFTLRFETALAVPFLKPQNEEVMDWLRTWIEANENLIWDYSGFTFRAICEVCRLAKIQILKKTDNTLHFVGYYKPPGAKQYEKIEILLDNEIPSLTEAFFKD